MAKLICTLDTKFIADYVIDKEQITIGRRQNNDIVIDNLAVSGLHAKVSFFGRDALIEDMDSTNGTIVNLKPIKKHVLNNGDLIEIGRHQFKYLADDSKTDVPINTFLDTVATTPLEQSPHTQPPSIQSVIKMARAQKFEQTAEEDLSATTPMEIPEQTPVPVLHVLNGSNIGKTLPLNKTLTTLGKTGVQVIVITKRSSGFYVSQIEGNKKFTINDLPPNSLSVALKENDVISISGIKMEFKI
jgi:predicted component of type VI protein secretion system